MSEKMYRGQSLEQQYKMLKGRGELRIMHTQYGVRLVHRNELGAVMGGDRGPRQVQEKWDDLEIYDPPAPIEGELPMDFNDFVLMRNKLVEELENITAEIAVLVARKAELQSVLYGQKYRYGHDLEGIQAEVYDFLKQNPGSQRSDIVAGLEGAVDPMQVSNACVRMRNKGLVRNEGDRVNARWFVTAISTART